MSGKLSSELTNWFLTLGFDDRNVSTAEAEEEFNRLSPPEMRDIWRNVMNHVLPIDRSRYIKKVLLLHELKKMKKKSHEKLLVRRNIDSVKKLHIFKSQEKIAVQVNKAFKAVEETNVEINNKSQQISTIENHLKSLMAENSKRSNQRAIIELKVQKHEKQASELFEIYSYLMRINSSWNSNDSENKHSSTEILKDILKKINDFGRRRNNENSTKIKDEQQLLMNDVVKLTSGTPVSELHKTVIYMLRDTLSALLKLSDYVAAKHDCDRNGHFNAKLIQLKRQSVELFIENILLKKKVDKLQEDIQNQRTQLLDVLAQKCDEHAQKNFEMWLDSESLKHSMMTRLNYLIKKEESLKRTLPMSVVPDFTNFSENDKLFKPIKDCKNQLSLMEQEITSNLLSLSDESINSFIKCQNHCKSRIEQFIKTTNSANYEDFVTKLTDSLKNETILLQKIDTFATTNQLLAARPDLYNKVIPDYIIAEFVNKSSFYVNLTKAYENFRTEVDNESLCAESLEKKRVEIQNEEEKFANHMRRLVAESKINLKSIEEHSNLCLKNYDLWTKSSVNEIIPENMILADRSFSQWYKRYISVIQCLRRQQRELTQV